MLDVLVMEPFGQTVQLLLLAVVQVVLAYVPGRQFRHAVH
jgi:hypothetical protein